MVHSPNLEATPPPDNNGDLEKSGGSKSNISSKDATEVTASEVSFPEGGLRAWLTVLGGCVLRSIHTLYQRLTAMFSDIVLHQCDRNIQFYGAVLHVRDGPIVRCLPAILHCEWTRRHYHRYHTKPGFDFNLRRVLI